MDVIIIITSAIHYNINVLPLHVNPFPLYPERQEHVKLPSVFLQSAFAWHRLPPRHSFTSILFNVRNSNCKYSYFSVYHCMRLHCLGNQYDTGTQSFPQCSYSLHSHDILYCLHCTHLHLNNHDAIVISATST